MRHTPFDEIEELFEGMRRSMWGEFDAGNRQFGPERRETGLRMETDDDGYVVVVDLPGFETEEIDLRFDERILFIRARHEVTDDSSARSRYVHEQLSIPGDVAVEEIDADYHNGVLEIRLPTTEDDQRGHRIDID